MIGKYVQGANFDEAAVVRIVQLRVSAQPGAQGHSVYSAATRSGAVRRENGGCIVAPSKSHVSTTSSVSRGGDSARASADSTSRQAIIDAATKAFARHGFDATTNKMIAKDAGVAPGLLYHYFDSKEALFAAVYADITRYRYERSSAVLRSQVSFSGKIEALARDLVEMWKHDNPYVEFHARTLYESRHEARLTEALAAARQETEQLWRSIVEEAKMRGDLPLSVPTAAAVDMCMGWFTGVVMTLPSRGAERTLASTAIFIAAVECLARRTS
jgi:AcrR family transcriptional regulator